MGAGMSVGNSAKSWRRRIGLPLALVGLASAWLLIGTSSAAAPNAWGLTGSEFQTRDGNLVVESDSGDYDWDYLNNNAGDNSESTKPDTFTVTMNADKDSGAGDDSFGNGTKEDSPVPSVVNGSIPPNKSDLMEFGSWVERNADGQFLHLFWSRVQDPSGTTNMDFELNEKACPKAVDPPPSTTYRQYCSANGITPVRTAGDLLITYDVSRGGSSALIGLKQWNGSAWETDTLAADKALGGINTTAIDPASALTGKKYSLRTFGEASIDLSEIFTENVCDSFGSAYLKSRSSDSFTSAIKDFIAPIPVNVSNCGQIVIEKRDDSFSPVAGATFAVYDSATPSQPVVQASAKLSAAINAATSTVTIAVDDVDKIPAHTALVRVESEWMRVTGRSATADTLTVERAANRLPTSSTSPAAHAVDTVVEAIASCTTAGSADATTPGVTGKVATCTVPDLLFGSYQVWETKAPAGYQISSVAAPATLTRTSPKAVVPVKDNRAPASIAVTKTDDSDNPLAGAVFYLYRDTDDDNKLTTVDVKTTYTCTTSTTAPESGTCTIGGILEPGEYILHEEAPPTGFGSAADYAITVALGTPYAPPTFVDPRHYTVIVLVCRESDSTLQASRVTLGGATTTTPTTLPSAGPSEAEVCGSGGLAGLTGTSVYPDQVKGTYAPSIVIPSPSPST